MPKHILKSKKAKTVKDEKILKGLVSSRHKKTKTKVFFGEFISPNELLDRQLKPRLDLIVRDLAVGHLLGENTIGLKLWKKLGGHTRIAYDIRVHRLQTLITGFKKYGGYITKYPIPVDGDYQLRGGAHRMVLSKRFNILEIPIFGRRDHDLRSKHKSRGVYNIPIMIRLGYTTEEIKYIWSLKNEFYGIT